MEFLVLLIFLAIGYNLFRNFMTSGPSKTGTTSGLSDIKSYLEKMQDGEFGDNGEWRPKADSPSARGRERLAQKRQQSSPWQDAEWKAAQTKQARLKHQTAARKASHKSPKQSGRRGQNIDQNRHRSNDWGERGDKGFLSGKTMVILLVILFGVLYALSQITPEMLAELGL